MIIEKIDYYLVVGGSWLRRWMRRIRDFYVKWSPLTSSLVRYDSVTIGPYDGTLDPKEFRTRNDDMASVRVSKEMTRRILSTAKPISNPPAVAIAVSGLNRDMRYREIHTELPVNHTMEWWELWLMILNQPKGQPGPLTTDTNHLGLHGNFVFMKVNGETIPVSVNWSINRRIEGKDQAEWHIGAWELDEKPRIHRQMILVLHHS